MGIMVNLHGLLCALHNSAGDLVFTVWRRQAQLHIDLRRLGVGDNTPDSMEYMFHEPSRTNGLCAQTAQ
jgi:hypothetical protein